MEAQTSQSYKQPEQTEQTSTMASAIFTGVPVYVVKSVNDEVSD